MWLRCSPSARAARRDPKKGIVRSMNQTISNQPTDKDIQKDFGKREQCREGKLPKFHRGNGLSWQCVSAVRSIQPKTTTYCEQRVGIDPRREWGDPYEDNESKTLGFYHFFQRLPLGIPF